MPKATYTMLLFLLTVGSLKMFSETKKHPVFKTHTEVSSIVPYLECDGRQVQTGLDSMLPAAT